MASLLFDPPKDENGNVKKIPKVAVYVAGAAFAMTTGLTLLVLPYVRQAARMQNTPSFLSNRHLLRPTPAYAPEFPPRQVQAASVSASAAATRADASSSSSSSLRSASTSSAASTPAPAAAAGPILSKDKAFNDREERALFGALEGEVEPVSPWLGAQALGLATALVFGSAALGAWGVARLMGVDNMADFASKMRETLHVRMPGLQASLERSGGDEPVGLVGDRDLQAGAAVSADGREWGAFMAEVQREIDKSEGGSERDASKA